MNQNNIDKIKLLYKNCNDNLTSFFSNLNKKRNKVLKEDFNNIKLKTCYFSFLKGSSIQALYNILNNINEYPLYKDRRLKNFQKF